MSLFNRLLKLNTDSIPLEDFFTELVVYLLNNNHEILCAWLKEIKLLDAEDYSDAYVLSQQEFAPLEGHNSASRPDILIELANGINRSVIFVESKIGSKEGSKQLSRYAEILHHRFSNYQNKYLLYITRDFEPKDPAEILQGIPSTSVQFKQLRWHQFYQFLTAQSKNILTQEIELFMQEHQMAHSNQFSSIDILALANFTKSLKLMEETLEGEVRLRFKQVLGAALPESKAFIELQRHERFLLVAAVPGTWWCGLGFNLKTASPTDYPTVRLILEAEPKSQQRAEIISAMQAICQHYNWQGIELNNPKAWSRIVREKSLQEFLAESDHVAAIKRYFLKGLDELEKIKLEYPSLPWITKPMSGNEYQDLEADTTEI